jgi:hypothetical protein
MTIDVIIASAAKAEVAIIVTINDSNLSPPLRRINIQDYHKLLLLFIFSGSAAQRRLRPPVVLQPSAGYGLLWLCSRARAMASCGSAAERGLWPPVALQPSAGYDLLWLCSPARAMASCGSAAQRRLWPPVALQPSAGYGLLVHEVSRSHTTMRHSR